MQSSFKRQRRNRNSGAEPLGDGHRNKRPASRPARFAAVKAKAIIWSKLCAAFSIRVTAATGSSKFFRRHCSRRFIEAKDLDVQIDRGFYQKPFIGSAVMSIFAKSLEDDATPGGRAAGLTAFSNTPTNFFLCGSLHGGTGACGVPVMANFLKNRKDTKSGLGLANRRMSARAVCHAAESAV